MRRSLVTGAFCLLLLIPTIEFMSAEVHQADGEQSYDVVVVGAGTGGIAAAIQAARLGSRVALLEETDWIGGQMTAAAVSTMDEGGTITLDSGLYAEFLQRMRAAYLARGKSVNTCYGGNNTHCYEPSVAQKVLLEMIGQCCDAINHKGKGKVDLYLRERVVKVLGTRQTVTGVVTQHQQVFHSKVVIDATEYGDVLPLTPAAYRLGNLTNDESGKACIQDITYAAVIRKYPHGLPSGLLMEHAPPGYTSEFEARMKRVLEPDGNPVNRKTTPVNFAVFNAYRGLPDSTNPNNYVRTQAAAITRAEMNWFNDYEVTTDIFDRSKRRAIVCAAKLKTLDLLYYIQHDLHETSWSIANDEGYDTPYNREENSCSNIPNEYKKIERNFPPLPYVRESRRLIGLYTLTGGDIRREANHGASLTSYSDAIAVGDYPDDMHGCNTEPTFEHDLEHATARPPGARSGPFQVPMRSLIPMKVDGLLAAEKNISQSRMANGSTRLQPITMLTGQAAGALAAIAVSENLQPRQVNPATVQRELLDFNSGLVKQELNDLPRNTLPWRAAEFSLVHGWLNAEPSGFEPVRKITRGESAEILAYAFQLIGPPEIFQNRVQGLNYDGPLTNHATFQDVPLYNIYGAAVEALVASHAVDSCATSATDYCPDDIETVGDFTRSLEVLNRSKRELAGVKDGSEAEAQAPLTREKAALLLFRSMEPTDLHGLKRGQ